MRASDQIELHLICGLQALKRRPRTPKISSDALRSHAAPRSPKRSDIRFEIVHLQRCIPRAIRLKTFHPLIERHFRDIVVHLSKIIEKGMETRQHNENESRTPIRLLRYRRLLSEWHKDCARLLRLNAGVLKAETAQRDYMHQQTPNRNQRQESKAVAIPPMCASATAGNVLGSSY